MKINENTKLVSGKVVLVPYEKKHVLKYHEWMKSEELQQLTASEPLTLEEEYSMQESWRNDDNKCTFIVLDKKRYDHTEASEIDSMVGDVNLFFNDEVDKSTAEIEIMIADPSARGQGIGKEALFCMMVYGFEELSVRCYTAKIGYDNHTSATMFTKIGFKEIQKSDVFRETTYELRVTDDVIAGILQGSQLYKEERYEKR
ncbi:N-acetyltransferase 9-like protein [Mya arenaria]|uniref:N-acetyltransferase 9-like protein n=1 Tax=Mya arenaria TaxID=6604 RepID=UPI0022E0B763|nr:N-acetyltransferase 9-like protein [Mya arenaria]